jgi:hypothetical protein
LNRLRTLLASVLLALPGSTSTRPRELEPVLSADSLARTELDAPAVEAATVLRADVRVAEDVRASQSPEDLASDGWVPGWTLLAFWFGSSVAFAVLWAAAGILLGRRSP